MFSKRRVMSNRRVKRKTTKSTDFFQRLTDDLLMHIFQRLDFSRVHARGVCRTWRELCHLPSIPFVCTNNFTLQSKNLLNKHVAAAQCLPFVHLRKPMLDIVGSYGQYVIANHAVPNGGPLIFKPFTGDTFSLPETSIFYRGLSSGVVGPLTLPLCLAAMSSSLTATKDGRSCHAVAGIDKAGKLYLCRVGADAHWISPPDQFLCVTDLFFHREELCMTTLHNSFKSTKLHDLFQDGGPRTYFSSSYRPLFPFEETVDLDTGVSLESRHMVSSCGELLVVTIYENVWVKKKRRCSFKVHRMEGRELVPVDDIGERMLFVGRGCSMSWSSEEFSNSAAVIGDGSYFTANCLYYVTWCDCDTFQCMHGVRYPCARDKLRNQKLWKLSLLNNQIVGPVRFSSIGSPMWITSQMNELVLK